MARRSGITADGRAVLPTATTHYGAPRTLRERRVAGVSVRLERLDQRGGPPLLRHVAQYDVPGGSFTRISHVQVPHHGMIELGTPELVAAIARDEARLLAMAAKDRGGVTHAGSVPHRS